MKRLLTTLGVFLISLSVINIREAVSQQQVDRSGLDILCAQPGDTYSACSKSGVSTCITAKGDSIVCDCKTEVCTKNEGGNKPNAKGDGVRGLVELKFLDIIRNEVNNLTSQMSSLLTGQSTISNQLGDVQALCSLSDLVPLARPLATGGTQTIIREPGDVCQRDSEGRLIFRVHNQGGIDAPASTTRVFFGCPNATCTGPTQVDVATPALPGFSGVELVVPIPNSCFSTTTLKCDFTIGVDVAEAVIEANETNNTTAGVCGPSIL